MVKTKHIRTVIAMRAMRRKFSRPLRTKRLTNYQLLSAPISKIKGVLFSIKNSKAISRASVKQKLSAATLFVTAFTLVIGLIMPGMNARASQTLTWSTNADFAFNKAGGDCQSTNIDKLNASGESYTDDTCVAVEADSSLSLMPDNSDLQGIIKVAAGENHSLALKNDGTVWAWGHNYRGQLGDDSTTQSLLPVQVKDPSGTGYLTDVVAIAAGSEHSLAVKADGTVWGWGYGVRGQLGNASYAQQNLPVQVKDPSGTGNLSGVVAVAGGDDYSLALKSDGTVWGMGYNNYGALGNNSTTQSYLPVQVKDSSGTGNLADITDIAAGTYHSVAVKTDGTVWAWGYNVYGQLGDDSTTQSLLPVQVKDPSGTGNLTDITDIAAGKYHSLAIKSDGTVWGWGYNNRGQLGDSSTTQRSLPVQVKDSSGTGNLTDITDIAASNDHSLAIKADGTVWGWGYNYYGQLGTDSGSSTNPLPVQAKDSSESGILTEITGVAAGYSHSLFLKEDGTVWGAGRNDNGQLGYRHYGSNFVKTPHSIVVEVEELIFTDVQEVAAGDNHSLALKNDGTVWAWGYNNRGQLGDGSVDIRQFPVQVKDPSGTGYLTDVVAIDAGSEHSLAVKADGTVWGWGYGVRGQLGNASYAQQNLPVQVKDPSGTGYLTNVVAVAGGISHSLVLKNDGTVWGMGYNNYGALGDNSSTNRSLPVQVKDSSGTGNLAGIIDIDADGYHSLVLRNDGTVWGMGYNGNGQLGNNSTTQSLLPVQVKDSSGTGNLADITDIAAGKYHSLAIKSDGTVWSWGYSSYGQLGIGNTTQSLLPVQVNSPDGTGYLTGIVAIDAGSAHSLALKNDGTAWAWGYNMGQLGIGSTQNKFLPNQVKDSSGDSYLSGVTAIAAGVDHTLAIKDSNDSVWAWGHNDYLQMAINDYYAYITLPTQSLQFVNYKTGFAATGSLSGAVFDIGQGKKTKWYGINWITTALPANTAVTFNARTSNDGEVWSEWTQDFAQNSTGSIDGSANIDFLPMSRFIEIKTVLSTEDNLVTPTLNEFSLSYLEDTAAPQTNASNIIMKRSENGASVAPEGWVNSQTAYFSWDAGVDVAGGSGIQGYCLYLGQDSTADLTQAKGVLGDSPLDTAGKCAYAVESTQLDLSQPGVLAEELQTDNSPYYLLIKAIDYGTNVYEGEAASFAFNYDDVPPTNPAFISAPSQFVSTKDVTLTWPSTGEQGPLDSDSQIAGLQYKIGTNGTWYGETHNGNQDLSDVLSNSGSYKTVEEFDYPLLNEGNNIVYFRTLDNAGNVSTSYITAVIRINTSSPSQPLNVTVDPPVSTANSFAFSWHKPSSFVGLASGVTYCYTINTLPNANNCSWTEPGVTSLQADAYATQPDENTFYVVAKDEAGNINYATYNSVSFTANTPAPGLPRDFEIADVSTKASETWKIALSWTDPADAGAGVAKYAISRSVDGINYSQIATTTGRSYVDGPLAQREYHYRIKACDSANNCGADTQALSMTPTGRYTTPPELISSVSSEVSTRRASFSWTTDRVSDSRIQYGTKSGEYMAGEVTVSEPTQAHFVELLGLDAGTTYFYKVKWTDEDGNTGISSELSFTTLPAPVVKDVEVIKKTLNSALIQFTSTDAARVSIVFGKSENFGGIKTINTSLTESTYIVELVGLDDGETYFYKLNTYDSEGNQYDSRRIDSFSTPPRPLISNLRFQPVEGEPTSTQKITWVTNVPASSTITYGLSSSNGVDIYSSKLTTSHTMTVRGLRDDSQYFLLAQSRDAGGNLAVSDRQLFRTALDTRPPKVSDVQIETSVKGNGSEARGQIVVSWKTDEPATSQVAYADGSGGNYTSRTAEDMRLTTEHVVIISDLAVSKVYHLQPISSDRAGNRTAGEDYSAIIGRASDSVLTIILNSLYKVFGL